MDDTLEAYTDGSSLPSPRRGGIGIRFVWCDEETGEEVIEDLSPPGYKGGTNNEMEVLACKTALEESIYLAIPESTRRFEIRTDCTYVSDNIRMALFRWPKQRWFRSSGAPVENVKDWKDLRKAYVKAKARFEVIHVIWVAKKSKHPHIKAAHRLAQASAKNATNPPRKVKHVRRKQSPEMVDPGCVKMEGQTFIIRIRTSELLPQKLWKCAYEVVSEDSQYSGKADIIYSARKNRLDAGHTYLVRVNEDTKNPRIEEILDEIPPQADLEDERIESELG
jgi:ribonuclease HI